MGARAVYFEIMEDGIGNILTTPELLTAEQLTSKLHAVIPIQHI